MSMREFREYAVNGREAYYAVPSSIRHRRDAGLTDSVMKWTLTIHEPTCRYAKVLRGGNVQNYAMMDTEKIRALQDYGFDNPSRYVRTVWKGCKVCGTFHREPEFRALAKSELARQAEANQRRAEARKAENAREAAERALTLAIKDAQEAYYAEHFKTQVDAAMASIETAVRAQWPINNPEQASLLTTEKEA